MTFHIPRRNHFSLLLPIFRQELSDYLLELKNMCKNDVISSKKSLIELSALEHLYSIGCLSNIGIDGIDGGDTEDVTINFDNGKRFRISEFGELLLDYIL